MSNLTFDQFKNTKLTQGFDEVLLREWAPAFANDPHTHPFDTEALVAQGEFWLTMDGHTTHFQAGDQFTLARGLTHSERYGPDGAIFWAARKY